MPGGGLGGSGGSGSAAGTGMVPPGDGPGFGGMAGGGSGGSGAGGLPAAYQGKNAFKLPGTSVVAFLAAVKSKNKDRLAETVAKRAPTEADEKHRKIFSEIIDGSISDDDLDEMAKALDGFQVMSVLQAKSTRVVKVVVSKMSGKDRLQRTIVTRQEIDGWKVLDIEAMYDFKPGLPPMFMRGGRGRRR
jgi:hypothetical protein